MGLYWNCTHSGEWGDIECDMGLYWNCTHSGEILSVIWVYTGTVPIVGRS